MRESYAVTVEWGDCDPAGIVFYPNFYRWFDAAYQAMLERRGLSQRELSRRYAIVGTALADTGARFLAPATYGDRIVVEARIRAWTSRSFTIDYRVLKRGQAIVEGYETRVFAVPASDGRLSAVPIPPEFKALFDSMTAAAEA